MLEVRHTGAEITFVAGSAMVAVSVLSWMCYFLLLLPDGGEFALNLASLSGVPGSLIALGAATVLRFQRTKLSALHAMLVGLSFLCLALNIGIIALFYLAYGGCDVSPCY